MFRLVLDYGSMVSSGVEYFLFKYDLFMFVELTRKYQPIGVAFNNMDWLRPSQLQQLHRCCLRKDT